MLAVTSLDDFGTWARGDGLEIVLLVLGSVLLRDVFRGSTRSTLPASPSTHPRPTDSSPTSAPTTTATTTSVPETTTTGP